MKISSLHAFVFIWKLLAFFYFSEDLSWTEFIATTKYVAVLSTNQTINNSIAYDIVFKALL